MGHEDIEVIPTAPTGKVGERGGGVIGVKYCSNLIS